MLRNSRPCAGRKDATNRLRPSCQYNIRWATTASLVVTCKLNAGDPFAYLAATLTAIVNGHKQSRIDELLHLNYSARV